MSNPTLIISKKELRDHLTSKKFIILVALLILFYLALISFSTTVIAQYGFRIRLFRELSSGLVSNISFIAPILGIALAYDALAGERERGSLKLLLSRPIYRENIINGKILGGFIAISIAMIVTTIIGSVSAIVIWGAAPIFEDLARLIVFTLLSILFTMCYYSLSLFFSSISNKSSRSAIIGISIWIFFTIVLPMVSSLIAFSILGPPPSLPGPLTNATTPGQIQISEEYRNYARKLNEISSSINAYSINYHFTTVSNRLFQAITMGIAGQQQTREISILDALSSSAINIFIMIFFTALFIILSYISFTRKEER